MKEARRLTVTRRAIRRVRSSTSPTPPWSTVMEQSRLTKRAVPSRPAWEFWFGGTRSHTLTSARIGDAVKKRKKRHPGGPDGRGGYIAGPKTASEIKPMPPAFAAPKTNPPPKREAS
jgi:hypothetical protein